jgi:hypothetical protein
VNNLKERQDYQKLAFAVLKQAFLDTQYKGAEFEGKQNRNDAIQWITNDSREEGSFAYWCSIVNLDPTTMRNGFLKARIDWNLKKELNNIFKNSHS